MSRCHRVCQSQNRRGRHVWGELVISGSPRVLYYHGSTLGEKATIYCGKGAVLVKKGRYAARSACVCLVKKDTAAARKTGRAFKNERLCVSEHRALLYE